MFVYGFVLSQVLYSFTHLILITINYEVLWIHFKVEKTEAKRYF